MSNHSASRQRHMQQGHLVWRYRSTGTTGTGSTPTSPVTWIRRLSLMPWGTSISLLGTIHLVHTYAFGHFLPPPPPGKQNDVTVTIIWPFVHSTYLVFWEQLVLCTVLRRRKNHFKNQNSCFFFQNQEALVCKPLFPHVSNAFSQQPLSYWQKCYSLNLSETRTLIRCLVGMDQKTCKCFCIKAFLRLLGFFDTFKGLPFLAAARPILNHFASTINSIFISRFS